MAKKISVPEFIRIVALALREGKSNQEIADQLGMKVSSFTVKLSKTRLLLKNEHKDTTTLMVPRKRGRRAADNSAAIDAVLASLMNPVEVVDQTEPVDASHELDIEAADEFGSNMSGLADAVSVNQIPDTAVDTTVG